MGSKHTVIDDSEHPASPTRRLQDTLMAMCLELGSLLTRMAEVGERSLSGV